MYTKLEWHLIINYEIWPQQFKMIINIPYFYIVRFKTRLEKKNYNKIIVIKKSKTYYEAYSL